MRDTELTKKQILEQIALISERIKLVIKEIKELIMQKTTNNYEPDQENNETF